MLTPPYAISFSLSLLLIVPNAQQFDNPGVAAKKATD
jgi:hypothetical protein